MVTDYLGINGRVADLALQGDGKIVVAGAGEHQGTPTNQDMIAARYNSDGTHDSTFGNNGHALVDFGADYEEAKSVAIQPDGKIVIGGYSIQTGPGYEWALARFNSNGTLDPTFGTAGKSLTDFPTDYDMLTSLKLLGDGRIVGSGNNYGRIARLTPMVCSTARLEAVGQLPIPL